MKIKTNKVKILSLKKNIFARKKSKAPSRVWIVQNNLHSAETLTKGTCTTKLDGNFAAEMKLQSHFIEHGRAYIKVLFMMAQ